MSDWHDEFTEPMHDTPADKDPLIAAMEQPVIPMTDLKAPTIISVSLAKAVRSLPWAAGMNARNG